MRLRRARTLVVTFVNSTAVLQNFMTRQAAPVDGFTIDVLLRADAWQSSEHLHASYPGLAASWFDAYLSGLVARGFLHVEGTSAAAIDIEYERFWGWEATAGLYHFGVRDAPWLNVQQAADWLRHLSASAPPVPLCSTNEGLDDVEALEPPDLHRELFAIMSRRRSVRSYAAGPVSIEALRDCLFAGLGITGFLNTQTEGPDPWVPLKMTPSGGGRNPYEAFVCAKNVNGLDAGVYHYSALDHSLGLVTRSPSVAISQVFAGQEWTEGAAFAILLVANFGRTMWKYPHPNAYRVVLMEAGHIGQNIALAAVEHGLSATPSGAVNDTAAQALLGLDWVRQSLVYAMFIGKPDPSAPELQHSVPHLA